MLEQKNIDVNIITTLKKAENCWTDWGNYDDWKEFEINSSLTYAIEKDNFKIICSLLSHDEIDINFVIIKKTFFF